MKKSNNNLDKPLFTAQSASVDPVIAVKNIQNLSMQALTIYFSTPEGPKDIFLRPKTRVSIPISWNSEILNTFVRRRLVKVTL